MKKKSRFLTGLLSAVMALSLFALPAAADNATSQPTIDTSRKGTLTINKYEGTDTTKPLADVKFDIYQVATIEQTQTANGVDVTMTPVAALGNVTIDSTTDYNTDTTFKAAVDAAIKNKSLTTAKDTVTTNSNGQAVFTELDVGVYLVIESDAPAQILPSSRTANFLVSIPMMNDSGDGWQYEITANPKNTPTYGGITLVKYGKTAGGQDNGAILPGATFILQHKNGETWTTINSFDGLKIDQGAAENGILTTGPNGTINISGLVPGIYRFVERTAPNGYIADGKKTYEFEVVDSDTVKAPDGVEDSTYLDVANKAITVVNERPDLEKTVLDGENYGAATDAKLGDEVAWKVEVKVPSKVNELDTFKITDEMSKGLDKPAESSFTIVTNKGSKVTLEKTTDYTLDIQEAASEDVGPKWVIDFTSTGKNKLATNEITTVTVTFKTVLNEKAVSGQGGNMNNAKLDYSNGFYDNTIDQGHPNPGEDTIEGQAIVFTFELNAVKKDGNNQDETLPGAEFTLYKYTGTAAEPSASEITANGEAIFNLVSGSDGVLKITGDSAKYKDVIPKLGKGTYYLIETKAPTYTEKGEIKHYNLLKDPIKVDLNVAYTVTKKTDEPKVDGTSKKTTITTKVDITAFDVEKKADNASITIYNKKGFNLPVTGGFGTLLFSGIGALLVVGGVGVLMSIKKKKGNV